MGEASNGLKSLNGYRKTVNKVSIVLSRLDKVSRRLNTILLIGSSIFLFFLMLYVVGDVTGRYVFLKPLLGTIEISEGLLVSAVFLSMASALIENNHIRIYILVDRLPKKWQDWLDILSSLIGFLFTLIITWQSLSFAIYSYNIKEWAGSSHAYFAMPFYPVKFIFFLGMALFCAQFFIRFLIRLVSRLSGSNN